MAKVNLPILYSQMDSRWSGDMLGFNTALPFNMYNYGCLVTSFAMVCRYFGKDTDPKRLNEALKILGAKGFQGGGNYVPGGVNLVYGDIKEPRTSTPSKLTDVQFAEIKSGLDNNYPVIIGIDVNPKDVDYDSHFVVVVDYDPSDENNLTIADPLGGKLRSLKDYLGWFKPGARTTIESYVICTGPKPKYGGEMIPILKEHYDLYLKNHDQWHKTVNYLKPGADPNGTLFEDVQTVIAGIKSRQTDLENQLKQAVADKATATQEIQNQKDKLANTLGECQRELKQAKDEYIALKSSLPDIEKLKGSYLARIDEVEGMLREAQKQVGLRDLEIAQLKSDVEVVGILQKLVQWVKDKLTQYGQK
jgi:hypothetical protein